MPEETTINIEEVKMPGEVPGITLTLLTTTSIIDSLAQALIRAGSLTEEGFSSELSETIAYLREHTESNYAGAASDLVERFLKTFERRSPTQG